VAIEAAKVEVAAEALASPRRAGAVTKTPHWHGPTRRDWKKGRTQAGAAGAQPPNCDEHWRVQLAHPES